MRYLLFFLFLFFSPFVFSQGQPQCQSVATASCTSQEYLSGSLAECSSFCSDGVCATGVVGMPTVTNFPPPSCSGSLNIVYSCASKCTCPSGLSLINGVCACPSGSSWSASHNTCVPVSCPPGQIVNVVVNNGIPTASCIDEPDVENPPDDCPNGVPKVNGQCTVCPGGHNTDGTCIDPTQCGEGEIKQGEINGTAVCAGQCSDPNQSWGFVNGVEGCYGAPSCPNGGSYGTVNGVSGCYGSNSSSGSNTSSGSGASAGSNTSSGSGTGGGSNTSSGSGGGGDNGGGNNGGGSGGSGGGSNNDIGAPYPVDVPCEDNFEKVGAHCVSAGQGDCITGYHELVVSRDPFLFICVANDTPPPEIPASSQPSASSQPNSSSPSSMQNSSSQNSGGSTGSSGSNTSSGSGSGSGGSGGDGEGAGDCDPTSTEYLTCIAGENNTQIKDIKLGAYTADMPARLQQAKDKYNQKIQNIKTQFQDQMSVNIASGSGGLPSNQITLYGQSFEAGIAARADFFELIRWAFFAAASILSLYILLSR